MVARFIASSCSLTRPFRLALVLITLLITLPQIAWGVTEEVTKTITFNKAVDDVSSNINHSTMSVSVKEQVTGGASTTYDGKVNIQDDNSLLTQYNCSTTDGAVFTLKSTAIYGQIFTIEIPGNYPAIPTQVTLKVGWEHAKSSGASGEIVAKIQVGDYDTGSLVGNTDPVIEDYANNHPFLSTQTSKQHFGSDALVYTANNRNGLGTNRETRKSLFIYVSLNGNDVQQYPTTFTIKEATITYNREAYGPVVAGIHVGDDNTSNVLSDDYSSVSYDEGSKTLTLKGVNLNSATGNNNITASSALTIHLEGYNNVGEINVYDGSITSALVVTATTNETLPGYLEYSNMAGHFEWNYQNGLKGKTENNKYFIYSESTNPYIIYATGYKGNNGEYWVSEGDIMGYDNEGNTASLDVNTGATVVNSQNNASIDYFKVSSSSQSCYLYPASLDDMNLVTKAYLLFDWGTCTNKSVKIQVRGLETNQPYPTYDGKDYSEEVSLPSTGGLVEIPLTGTITSDYVQLYFSSSTGEFSFIPISIGFQKATSYGISVAGTEVTSANASRITGTGISGTVTYDASTNTLTLNGAGITSDYNALTYSGNTLLNIELNGTNSITATYGTYTINTTGSGNIKFVKATGASTAAELTVSSGDGSQYVFNGTNPSLGSSLYWKPIAGNQMVITEDPNFLILDGEVIPAGTTINGTSGSLKYNASDKILTLTGYTQDFGAQHAIKTGVSGLKVMLVGASTITCSADSAVFHAFSSSASIQFVRDDATSKLTMTGTAFNNFGSSSITYDGLFYYSDNTNKVITQAAAPALSRERQDNGHGIYYTYALIDYAASDKSGGSVLYSAANPLLKYSFDYADPQKQDVSDQVFPEAGIKMTDPGILTTWVEVGTYKGPESKGVRFGLLENPIEIEFDGTKQISITPAPTMTNPVTYSVHADYTEDFDDFAVLDNQNNKITINSCYDGVIGFTFVNNDGGYTSLNLDSTNVSFEVIPSKPTLSLESGAYYIGQQITATPTVPNGGYNTYFKINDTSPGSYTYTFNSAGIFNVSSVSYYIRGGGLSPIFGKYATATIVINNEPTFTASVGVNAYNETNPQSGNVAVQLEVTNLQANCTLRYYLGNDASKAVNYDAQNPIILSETNTINAYIRYTDNTVTPNIVYDSAPVSKTYTVKQEVVDPFGNDLSYRTCYLSDYSLNKPDGIKVYIITGVSGNSVTTTAIDYIPQGVAVLLEKDGNAPAGGYVAETYTGAAGNFSGNMLKYADADVTATDDLYILYKNEFVKATGVIPIENCYLDLSSVNPSRGMYDIGDGATAIKGITLSEGEEVWYDLQGRRIERPTKPGLYIRNGKKVVVNNK